MTIFVDEPFKMVPRSTEARKFGIWWCHLTTDGPIEELHQFAIKVFSPVSPRTVRSWFQDNPTHPHYHLTAGQSRNGKPTKRELAIAMGAVEITTKEQVRAQLGIKKGEQTPYVEYDGEHRARRCHGSYNGKPCHHTTRWVLQPQGMRLCRTCALYLATNNHAEVNAAVLAPMLGTSTPEPWRAPKDTGVHPGTP